MATEHTPLLEPIPDEPGQILTTFLWRAAPDMKGVVVLGRQMTRLLETDLWFLTLKMDRKVPIFYSFFPQVAGDSQRQSADPLNPHGFAMAPEVQAVIPLDLQAVHSPWSRRSMLLFQESAASHWTEMKPGIPKGKVEMHSLEEKGNARIRRLWVYTPPDYDPEASVPYRLLICFDGASYLSEIPAPTILNNLLEADEIWPTVAVMVDNGDLRASAEDLDNHAAFADFMGRELMPWVYKNWRVSRNPAHTIVCGYSRGGLGATYVAWKYPGFFGNVLSQSGAFWRGNEGSSDDPEWLTQQFKASPKLNLRFYIEVGAEETRKTPGGPIFTEANERLCRVLEAKGYAVRFVKVSGGRHGPINWRFQLAEGIMYLSGKHLKALKE
jgi:enterochelin esterase family protein